MARFSYRSVSWGPPSRDSAAPPEQLRARGFITAYAGTHIRRPAACARWAPQRDTMPRVRASVWTIAGNPHRRLVAVSTSWPERPSHPLDPEFLPARWVFGIARPIVHRRAPGLFLRGSRPEGPPVITDRVYVWYAHQTRHRRPTRQVHGWLRWRGQRPDVIVPDLPNTPIWRRVVVADRQRVIHVGATMSRREPAERWQDPNAYLDHMIDWADYLQSGEQIDASAWAIEGLNDGALTIEAGNYSISATVIWATGGTVGASYLIRNRITTSHGRIDDQSILLYITQM